MSASATECPAPLYRARWPRPDRQVAGSISARVHEPAPVGDSRPARRRQPVTLDASRRSRRGRQRQQPRAGRATSSTSPKPRSRPMNEGDLLEVGVPGSPQRAQRLELSRSAECTTWKICSVLARSRRRRCRGRAASRPRQASCTRTATAFETRIRPPRAALMMRAADRRRGRESSSRRSSTPRCRRANAQPTPAVACAFARDAAGRSSRRSHRGDRRTRAVPVASLSLTRLTMARYGRRPRASWRASAARIRRCFFREPGAGLDVGEQGR